MKKSTKIFGVIATVVGATGLAIGLSKLFKKDVKENEEDLVLDDECEEEEDEAEDSEENE